VIAVRGTVRRPDGTPVASVEVRVAAQDLRGTELLTSDATGLDGSFAFEIDREPLRREGMRRALVVQAVGSEGEPLASVEAFDVPELLAVELVVPDVRVGMPRLERVQHNLARAIGEFDVAALDAGKVGFVAEAAGEDAAEVRRVAASQVLAARTGWPVGLAYAADLAGLPAEPDALLALPDERVAAAVRAAVDAGAIGAAIADEELRGVLRRSRVAALLRRRDDDGVTTIGRLLSPQLPEGADQRLVEAYLDHPGDPETFWAEAPSLTEIDPERLATVEGTLRLAVAAAGHQPLVDAILNGAAPERASDPRTLARLDERGWEALLAGDGNGRPAVELPPFIGGEDDEQRRARYAAHVTAALERDFPVQALAGRLEHSDVPDRDALLEALAAAEPSDLLRPDGAPELAALKRVHAVTARATDTVRLLEHGVSSALQIAASGREAFVARVEDALVGDAGDVHDRAGRVSARVLATMGRILDDHQLPLAAVPRPDEAADVVSWPQLFGSLDACTCDECQSVHGPSAYLVDLLALLRDADGRPGERALAELERRRSDILDLELSCRNTSTSMPYVDLVCEVLERALDPAAAPPPTPIASSRPTDELLAEPEHVLPSAYALLAEAPFPWSLPFDLPLLEARTYLEHLGVPRHDLRRRLRRAADGAVEPGASADELGFSPGDRALLASGDPAEPWTLWGLPPAAGGATWHAPLEADVPLLLRQTDLELADLSALLAAPSVNPTAAVALDPPYPCAVGEASLVGADEGFFERLRRFERVRRQLRWSVTDLDLLLVALEAAAVEDGDLWTTLATVRRLQRRLRLDVALLATFWGDVPASAPPGGGRSLWDEVFDSPAARRAGSASPFTLDAGGNPTGGGTVLQHSAAVQAALGLGTDDVAAVLRAEGVPDLPLSVAELSRLHRIARLSRALGIGVAGLLQLQTLTGQDPFATPQATATLVECADAIAAARLRPDELSLLLSARAATELERTAGAARHTALLTTVRHGVARIRGDAVPVPDPEGLLTRAALEALLAPGDVAAVHEVIAGTSTIDADAQAALLDAQLGPFVDTGRLAPSILGPEALTEPAPRFAAALGSLAARDRALTFAIGQIAGAYALEPGTAELLARRVATPSGSLLDLVTAPAFTADSSPLTPASDPERFGALARLDRIPALLAPHRLSPRALAVLLDHHAAGGWLALDAIPGEPDAAGAPVRMSAWRALRGLLAVARACGHDEPLFDTLAAAATFDAAGATPAEVEAARTAAIDRLADIPAWPRDRIDTLVGADGLDLTFPEDLRTATGLERLAGGLDVLARLGVEPAVVRASGASWIDERVTPAAAAAIRRAAAARHPDDWTRVARGLQDRVRLGKRDALVARLGHLEQASTADLFGRYLLDVEMDPCQLTSRIKQAIGSVQLLIQRALLTLEPDVRLRPEQVEAWREWMHAFRIWQANRKVFLWPERWIRPELRDDRTPLFRRLQDALNQGEVDEGLVEQALRDYIDGLQVLGGLELSGSHLQRGSTRDTDVLHLFGRTRGEPHQLHYRRLEGWRTWTAWEEVPVEVTADQVAPAVFNRRMYLFWLLPQRKAERRVEEPDERDPQHYWDIKLAWSERRNGAWTSKRIATEAIVTDFPVGPDEESGRRLSLLITLKETRLDTVPVAAKLLLHDSSPIFGGLKKDDTVLVLPPPPPPELLITVVGESSWVPMKNIRFAEWVGRWRLGGCEEEPRVTWARKKGGPVPKTVPFWWPMATQTLAALRLARLNDQDGGPLEVVENASSASDAAPKVRAILGNTPGGSRVVLRADHERWPYDDTFFIADPAHAWLVRARRSRSGPARVKPDRPVDLGRVAESLGKWRTFDVLGKAGVLPPEGQEEIIDPVGPLGSVVTVMQPPASRAAALEPGLQTLALRSVPAGLQHSARPLATAGRHTAKLSPVLDSATDAFLATTISGSIAVDDTWTALLPTVQEYAFTPLHHASTCDFIKALNRGGVDALLDLATQYPATTGGFSGRYDPTDAVPGPHPDEDLDFGEGGVHAASTAFGTYNWELFFHAPLLLASRLSAGQRFAEARRWLHFVFDPTRGATTHPRTGAVVTDARRAWRFRPFFERAGHPLRIDELLDLLGRAPTTAQEAGERAALVDAIDAWRADPFKPHLVARYRPGAYQKHVVTMYVQNLIAWADSLFARDMIEAINEATQLYLLALQLLGERPTALPAAPDAQARTFRDLEPHLDEFSNAMVMLESRIAAGVAADEDPAGPSHPGLAHLLRTAAPYFCVPLNDELTRLWDTIDDRLLKVRTCRSLEGVERQLDLFEPAIDPGLLVSAAAAGLPLDAVPGGAGAGLPQFRFGPMLVKALELASEVRGLGAALLGALERRDAEQLALVRASQERRLLDTVRKVRLEQITDAEQTIATLEAARQLVAERSAYFAGREKISSNEALAHDALLVQTGLRIGQGVARLLAGVAGGTPDFTVGAAGWSGSPVVTVKTGGSSFASVAGGIADGLGVAAEVAALVSQQASWTAANERRWDDWQHQLRLAQLDDEQIGEQLAGARARLAAAERELDAHDARADHAAEFEDLLRSKFTNKQLFDWMVGQASSLHFQAYQLALAAARRAERCHQYELAVDEAFIGFEHWDSLRKGLLAGERLIGDLRRLEADHLNRNRREHELTKHVSLALRDPLALEQLRSTGVCEVTLPEWLFDLDHPGHYLRRLRSVSLTLPAVVGPYTSVNARVTLQSSQVRMTPELRDGDYLPADPAAPDDRFRTRLAPVQRIATSRGQSDSGLFELNLHDERYLPFEGAGAVSRWSIELDPDCNAFDLTTLADVIFELRYTARDGGELLRRRCKEQVVNARPSEGLGPLLHATSASGELSDAWHAFLYPPADEEGLLLRLPLVRDRLPHRARRGPVEVTDLRLALRLRADRAHLLPAAGLAIEVTRPDGQPLAPPPGEQLHLRGGGDPALAPLPGLHATLSPPQQPGTWEVRVAQATVDALPDELLAAAEPGLPRRLNPDVVQDVLAFQTYVLLPGPS
jgi:hypothetical protein